MTTTTTTTTSTSTGRSPSPEPARYLEPDWLTTNVFNRLIRRLTRLGISIRGSRELWVRGRTTGEWRRTPVNPLTVDEVRYLVAPRGTTQWVRNVRAAGGGELHLGRTVERFTVEEVADAEKAAVLRPYLRLWKAETGVFFDGLTAASTDAELVAAGPKHPVFRITTVDGPAAA